MSWFTGTQPLPSVGESPHDNPRRSIMFNPAWAEIMVGLLEFGLTDTFWAGDQSSKDQSFEWVQQLIDIIRRVGIMEFCIASDQRTSGVQGGSSLATTWHTRSLNNVVGVGDWYSLANPVLTLQSGKYLLYARAPGYSSSWGRLRVDVGSGNSYIYGASMWEQWAVAAPTQGDAILMGFLEITEETPIFLQHYFTIGTVGYGLGIATSLGVPEVYAQLAVLKVE